MLAARLSSAMPAYSSVCAIWARRTSPFVSRSVLSGEITPSSIRRSMYLRLIPDRLAASAREYSATRPGYGARTAGGIAQGFSTRHVTRLKNPRDRCRDRPVGMSLEWIDERSSWRMRPRAHARPFDHVGIAVAALDTAGVHRRARPEAEGPMFVEGEFLDTVSG